MTSAVVFAYHDVGVRCLHALLAAGVRIPLVVTHRDNPAERIWFASVARTAADYAIETITPDDPNTSALSERLASLAPDFLFSFYYRHMLAVNILQSARRGAYNMHGSLLPKYRGRVPVNWAVIHGERETGSSLHEMVAKPDAGRLVDQLAVPILANDNASDVFRKVTLAAEIVLVRSLPGLVAGTAPHSVQDLSRGSYFGGRKPEDGRIDWSCDAWSVHNLVRAVAPPYPGAFCTLHGETLRIEHTLWRDARTTVLNQPALIARDTKVVIRCADGGELDLLAATLGERAIDATLVRTHPLAVNGSLPLKN